MEDKIRLAILSERDLGKALRLMEDENIWRAAGNSESLMGEICDNYGLMKDFMLKGFKDPQIDDVYLKLLRKAYKLHNDSILNHHIDSKPSYSSAKRAALPEYSTDDITEQLEGFVQNVALSTLDGNASESVGSRSLDSVYMSHFQALDHLFCQILVSKQWNKTTGLFFEKLLLSPTVDANDQCLVISAIMMSCMNVFDPGKWMALANVYMLSTDERVRQRALVGLAFSLPNGEDSIFPKLKIVAEKLAKDPKTRKDLLELQVQVLFCNNTDADTERIKRDIIPALLKNNNLKMTRSGIVEKEDDPMKDILDPGAADLEMEEMEASFNKMVEMQKAGSDIYFGGFSQMKRFPFFNTMSNWFCPFYAEHPQIGRVKSEDASSRFLQVLFENGPFCDSDKYSFALAFSSVINHLPANMKEMMNSNAAFGHPGLENTKMPEYIRRMYLQDIYRFFRLNNNRNDFKNPFERLGASSSFLICHSLFRKHFQDEAFEFERFLYKKKRYDAVVSVSKCFPEPSNADCIIVLALAHKMLGGKAEALRLFERVLAETPDSSQALKGAASACFSLGEYGKSAAYYEQLEGINPGDKNNTLNHGIALISGGQVDKGMALLFKLSYQYPYDIDAIRAIAWGYLMQGKPENADAEYTKIFGSGKQVDSDYLNAGYAKWFSRDVREAANLFRSYVEIMRKNERWASISFDFDEDEKLLLLYGVGDSECRIMADIAEQ